MACSVSEEGEVIRSKNYISDIDFKVLAKDSFEKPEAIYIDESKLIVKTLKEAKVSESNSNIVKAGKPDILIPSETFVTTPGKDSIPAIKAFPRKDSILFYSAPEIVVAKDMGNKDQNPANFSYFSTLQGLKHDVYRTIFQDSRGNLWFTSFGGGGLTKYDGKYFHHYTSDNGLPDNTVVSMYEDSKGNLWLGTYHYGVIKFDGKGFTMIYLPADPETNVIWETIEDNNGNIWFTTGGGGVWKMTEDSLYQINTDNGLAGNYVNHVMQDKDGLLWFSAMGGVSTFDGKELSTYRFEKNETNSILVTEQLSDGDYWMGTWYDGLIKYDGKDFYHYSKNSGLEDLAVGEIIEGPDGKIWKISYGGGMTSFDGEYYRTYKEEHGLGNNYLLGFMKDKNSKFWIATQRAGVNRYNGDLFTHIRGNEGLANNSVRTIFEDNEGKIWIGTFGGGFDIYDGKTFKNYSLEQGLQSNRVYHIYEDSKGIKWIADGDKGLNKLEGNQLTHYRNLTGDAGGFRVFEDSKGDIWMLTYEKGIFHLSGDSIYIYKQAQGQQVNNNRSILEDSLGRIWIGTAGGGIVIMEEDSLRYITPEVLSDKVVNTMILDHKNRIWAGTQEGVNIIEGNKIYKLNTEDGIQGKTIESIYQDSKGHIWLATSSGLNRLDSKNYDALFNSMQKGEIIADKFYFKNYSYSNGFLGVGCNRNAFHEDRNGDIWIGARDRLTIYHPEGDIDDTIPPNLEIRKISLYNEDVTWSKFIDSDSSYSLSNGVKLHDISLSATTVWNNLPENLSLAHDNNYLSFEFIGITMNNPEKVTYRYKMEGLEEQWNQNTERNLASYGNMPFGDFTFKVQARNSQGYWSEVEEFHFEIRPPWYQTWTARSAFLILAVLVIVGQGRYRTRNLKRRQEELIREVKLATKEIEAQKAEIERNHQEMDQFKSRFFTNITHEFRTPLTVILGATEELGAGNTIGEMIKRNGKRLLNLINQILDLSKLESGRTDVNYVQLDVVRFINYLSDSYKSLFDTKQLKYSFNSNSKELLMDIDESKFQSLFGNLISNAIKYTPKGKGISVDLKHHGASLNIRIKDEGPGIPEDALKHIFDRFYQVEGQKTQHIGSGVGLALCKEIVKTLGGEIKAANHPDGGAEFEVSLPIHNNAQLKSDYNQKVSDSIELDQKEELEVESEQNEDLPMVLLVEDEPDIRTFIKNCLKESYKVEFAENGKVGVERAFDLIPDIVISDVMMPIMDGLEFTNHIKQDIRTSHIPVIMLTAKIDIESRLAGLKQGADAYLAKPFNKEELNLHLQNFLNLRESIHKQYKEEDTSLEKELPKQENSFLVRIRDIIIENLDDDSFGIKELCSEMGMSRMQIHRKLKALIGKSTTDYINDIRLGKAIEMLENEELNISEIAYSVGYSDPNYFSRVFQKKHNISPSQYRESRSG